ncbi:MAG: putative neurogenic locus notch-like protein 2-like protein [Faunusvirus sp.]|jgi:ankyrin repeat protein|uniref:Putative neurogenic locus notch-like protein 2-like protein n=1 Tax=Faunusvirus sp. TaxID=2487766 RepID=A0A3G5A1F2_9VIRU|nr:MAG: putative neurogenic locus notch-like protein 2-like protein [Faunusvirus sp.]
MNLYTNCTHGTYRPAWCPKCDVYNFWCYASGRAIDKCLKYIDTYTEFYNERVYVYTFGDLTPFMIACIYNLPDVALRLVKCDIDLTICDRSGRNAFMLACHCGLSNVACAIVDKTKNLNGITCGNDTYLTYACTHAYDCEAVVIEIIDRIYSINSVDINTQNNDGQTALIIATKDDNQKIVSRLIHENAEINKIDIHGKTALCYAIVLSDKTIAIELIKNGANIDIYYAASTLDILSETLMVTINTNYYSRILADWMPIFLSKPLTQFYIEYIYEKIWITNMVVGVSNNKLNAILLYALVSQNSDIIVTMINRQFDFIKYIDVIGDCKLDKACKYIMSIYRDIIIATINDDKILAVNAMRDCFRKTYVPSLINMICEFII